MITDAVVHLNGEQPLLVDMKTLPTAADVCLVCTNLRYVDGRKPTFIDNTDSWFMIPIGLIRFVEVPRASVDRSEGNGILALPAGPAVPLDGHPATDSSDPDADLLRRIREA